MSELPSLRAFVRRFAIFFVVPDFVEIIFVQLSHKTGEVTVFEMLRQDSLGKLLVLYAETSQLVTA